MGGQEQVEEVQKRTHFVGAVELRVLEGREEVVVAPVGRRRFWRVGSWQLYPPG